MYEYLVVHNQIMLYNFFLWWILMCYKKIQDRIVCICFILEIIQVYIIDLKNIELILLIELVSISETKEIVIFFLSFIIFLQKWNKKLKLNELFLTLLFFFFYLYKLFNRTKQRNGCNEQWISKISYHHHNKTLVSCKRKK